MEQGDSTGNDRPIGIGTMLHGWHESLHLLRFPNLMEMREIMDTKRLYFSDQSSFGPLFTLGGGFTTFSEACVSGLLFDLRRTGSDLVCAAQYLRTRISCRLGLRISLSPYVESLEPRTVRVIAIARMDLRDGEMSVMGCLQCCPFYLIHLFDPWEQLLVHPYLSSKVSDPIVLGCGGELRLICP